MHCEDRLSSSGRLPLERGVVHTSVINNPSCFISGLKRVLHQVPWGWQDSEGADAKHSSHCDGLHHFENRVRDAIMCDSQASPSRLPTPSRDTRLIYLTHTEHMGARFNSRCGLLASPARSPTPTCGQISARHQRSGTSSCG